MKYPTLQYVEAIIRRINRKHNAKIVISNRGQLEFALEKPKMVIYGMDRYAELYQKAAVLMETITQAHALSDGNKRVAMMSAQTMVRINGGYLVLPLKSIRLSVDTARYATDEQSKIVEQWFKVHTATDTCHLCPMLSELDEEENIIRGMLEQDREDDANRLLDRWMVFDNYPESRRAYNELVASWKKSQERSKVAPSTRRDTDGWRLAWISFASLRDLPHAHGDPTTNQVTDERMLQYNCNSMAELQASEERIRVESVKCNETNDVQYLFQNALRLQRYSLYHDAIDMFKRILVLDKDDSHALFHMALITQHGINDPESALKYWNRYAVRYPDQPKVNFNIGWALLELGRYGDALAFFGKLSGADFEIDTLSGTAYAGLNQHGKAIECYRRALSSNPDNISAIALMGISYSETGDYRRALKCFDKAIDSGHYLVHYKRGIALARMGRHDEAMADYKQALAANPRHLESRKSLALAMSYSGRLKEAITHFRYALDDDPNSRDVLHGLALALTRVGRHNEALVHINRILELYPSDADTRKLKDKILSNT